MIFNKIHFELSYVSAAVAAWLVLVLSPALALPHLLLTL